MKWVRICDDCFAELSAGEEHHPDCTYQPPRRYCSECGSHYRGEPEHHRPDGTACPYYAGLVHHHNDPGLGEPTGEDRA